MDSLSTACPELTALSQLIGDFAALLTPAEGNAERISTFIDAARSATYRTCTLSRKDWNRTATGSTRR